MNHCFWLQSRALCFVLALCRKPIGCLLPSSHPQPLKQPFSPAPQRLGYGSEGEVSPSLPHNKHFPGGKSVELFVSQNSVPSPWKWKVTIGFCAFSKLASQKRPSAQFQLCSTKSQVCDDRGPNPSPFVSNQVGFSSSSFTNIFPYLPEGPDTQRKEKRKRAECEIWL